MIAAEQCCVSSVDVVEDTAGWTGDNQMDQHAP